MFFKGVPSLKKKHFHFQITFASTGQDTYARIKDKEMEKV